jgi:hypothetical protein
MQPKLLRLSLIAIALCAALAACNNEASKNAASAPAAASRGIAAAGEPASPPPTDELQKTAEGKDAANNAPVASSFAQGTVPTPPVSGAQLSSSAASYTDGQRKFIRTAHAEFKVGDVYRSSLAIEDIAAAQGGFVVSNDIGAQTLGTKSRSEGNGKLIELTEYTLHGNLVVRVPSERTQTFLRAIAGQMEFLDQRRFEANDAQFDLLRQQLAMQRAQEAQLEIGAAEQAGGRLDRRTEAVQSRDAQRAARDEALIARRQFEDRIDFSTIDLSMYQSPTLRRTERADVEQILRESGPGFFLRLGNALRGGWDGLLDFGIGTAALWPLWLLLAGAHAVLRAWRIRRAATLPEPTAAPVEPAA